MTKANIEVLKEMIANNDLSNAVVEQLGGIGAASEILLDVANHGASGGFVGFTYYNDTVEFFDNNRTSILIEICSQIEEGIIELENITDWECFNDVTHSDVIRVMCGIEPDYDVAIKNGFAWFALESVANDYLNQCEQSED